MIHFHGGPLSGGKDQCSRFWRGRHAMVSFAYPEQLPIIADSCQSFALDNGAFSAWKSGHEFDMAGYELWVEKWARHPGFAWCLVPDRIDGNEADNRDLVLAWLSRFNQKSVSMVPVWHLHESLNYLRWLAANFQTVAMGSSGAWRTPGTDQWWERIGEALAAICVRGVPSCKLHGLRMLNPDIFTRIPFASADSTNAAQNAGSVSRFGSYPAPEAWQRATAIADRIEAYNSAPVWIANEKQLEFTLESCT